MDSRIICTKCGGEDLFFFFKQKTAYEMRISDWSSDVCSSDLRAPNIVELDSPSKQKGTTITDPTLNNAAFVINTFEQGNPALKPEIADTITLGLVYRPTASSGLRASVDGYDIKIKEIGRAHV